MIFVTHMETTPNPNALKYVLNEVILEDGICQYSSPAEAEGDLARAFFAILPSYNILLFCFQLCALNLFSFLFCNFAGKVMEMYNFILNIEQLVLLVNNIIVVQ